MEYQGFRSVSQYEKECARLGYTTRRVPFHSKNRKFFVLITEAPPSPTCTAKWSLIAADESALVLDGIVSRPDMSSAFVGNVDANYLGTLAAHGYFPDEAGEEERLRRWLTSPEFRRWVELPARREPVQRDGSPGRMKPPIRVWLATWAVPYETRQRLEQSGVVFPAYDKDGYVPGKKSDFDNWQYYTEPSPDNPDRKPVRKGYDRREIMRYAHRLRKEKGWSMSDALRMSWAAAKRNIYMESVSAPARGIWSKAA